jgi:hypothetical protein
LDLGFDLVGLEVRVMVEEVEMVVVGGYRQCIDVVVGRWRV